MSEIISSSVSLNMLEEGGVAVNSSNCDGDMSPQKLLRPYTPYHLFFKLERNYILQTNNDGKGNGKKFVPTGVKQFDQDTSQWPPKYRDNNILMPKEWFLPQPEKRKRRDHEVHGVISFWELNRLISRRWRSLDADTKKFFQDLAAQHSSRYHVEKRQHTQTHSEAQVKRAKVEDETTKYKDENDSVVGHSDTLAQMQMQIQMQTQMQMNQTGGHKGDQMDCSRDGYDMNTARATLTDSPVPDPTPLTSDRSKIKVVTSGEASRMAFHLDSEVQRYIAWAFGEN